MMVAIVEKGGAKPCLDRVTGTAESSRYYVVVSQWTLLRDENAAQVLRGGL